MYAGGYLHDPRDVKLAAEKQTVVMPGTQESVRNFVCWKSLVNFTASSQVHGKSVGE